MPKAPEETMPFSTIYEILNPLHNLNLSVEMLRSVTLNNEQQVYLDVIERSAMRINNSLGTFFISSRPVALSHQENSVHQLLDEVLEIANEGITRKRIVVSKEYAAPDNKIVLNRPAMKIAFINIIMNAIAGMIQGEGQLKLKTKIINGKYVLRIEDNGPGINRADGQGLATAFYILRSNYIGIDVESDEGRGTNFILIFKSTN